MIVTAVCAQYNLAQLISPFMYLGCHDLASSSTCDEYKKIGMCDDNYLGWMNENCPKSCKKCL